MRSFVLGLAALALSGCVTAGADMLDSRTAIISGRGNAYASMAAVRTKALRKAAQETVAHGFTHFIVMEATDETRTGIIQSPSGGQFSGTATTSCTGVFCNTSFAGQQSGAGIYAFDKPGADLLVRFLTEQEAQSVQGAWSAADILATAAAQ